MEQAAAAEEESKRVLSTQRSAKLCALWTGSLYRSFNHKVLQFPVRLIFGRNLDFSHSTIPTVGRYKKYSVFGKIDLREISLKSIVLETVVSYYVLAAWPQCEKMKEVRIGFSVGHNQLVVLLPIGSLVTDHNDMVIRPC